MKKIFVLVVLLVTFALNARAQEFKAGLVIGGVASQVDGDRMAGFYKAGFTGGLFVYRDISKVSRFQGELLYTMKGSRANSKNTDYSLYQISADYIDINLLYIYKVFDWLNFRIGLTPNVLISAKEETQTGLSPVGNPPAFRRFGISTVAGLSYYFTQKMNITWSYNYSLYSIRSGNSEIYDLSFKEQNSQHHSYMSFTLGYRF